MSREGGSQKGVVVLSKRLTAVVPVLAVAVLVVIPAVAVAAPRWVINGNLDVGAGAKEKQQANAWGDLTLTNEILHELTCKQSFNFNTWNGVDAEGTERGFDEQNGYYSWQCKGTLSCKVTNDHGVKKEGIYTTAEGPPSLTGTEKIARRTGNTSLPWIGELPTKVEPGGQHKSIHNFKAWLVVPVDKSQGGPGEGLGCELLGGSELAFEDREGPTEKETGYILSPKYVNGLGNGLTPSHLAFTGERGKTEKGFPETGRLNSQYGAVYVTGELLVTGWTDVELVTIKE
jgi:hypothetical protein